jgi:type IV pilus assembly protein PilV
MQPVRSPARSRHRVAGFTLLEVLITLIVLAVGMLGLANLQSKIHVTEIESYQRAHAVLLLQDMTDRINSNRTDAASYANVAVLGTGTAVQDCSVIAALAARDRCQWSNALLGASETRQVGGVTTNVGGLISARGCITQVQAPNPAIGVCTPGIYRVTVAWQGLHKTKAPADACGLNLYGSEPERRAISMDVSIGLPRCASP